jgi:peptidoglycan hydrolase-like protein with peptidoglycan-binding domain
MAMAAAAIVLLAALWGSMNPGSHGTIVQRQPTPSSGVLGIHVNAPQPTATTGSASPAPAAVALTYAGDLAHGSSGDAVRALQARLRQLHYYAYPTDTGYFGDATVGAVYTFQQARGLPATGVADRATIAALNACDQSCVY